MPQFPIIRRLLGLTLLAGWLTPFVHAATEEWTDTQGHHFKGEPSQIVGPFVLFRTGNLTSFRTTLDKLSPEDCARVAKKLAVAPHRAATLAATSSELSKEVLGLLTRVDKAGYVPVDATKMVEPELYLVVHASASNGDSWKMLGKASELLGQAEKLNPGLMDGVYMGYDQNSAAQHDMPVTMNWPGFVPRPEDQPSYGRLMDFFSRNDPAIVLLTRDGVPVIGCGGTTDKDLQAFGELFSEIVSLASHDNPKAWGARLHYERIARPILHANDSVPPLLLGNPMRADGLVERGIRLVDANVSVDATGKVTGVAFAPDSIIPEAMRKPVASVFRRNALFVPAIDKGRTVAGTYHYLFDLRGNSGKTTLADLRGCTALPIQRWLVLKPLRVIRRPMQLSTFSKVSDDGTVTLTPFYVGAEIKGAPSYKAQKEAFDTDWFDADDGGVLSLHPAEGRIVEVWGDPYTWKTMTSETGVIDFQEGSELNWVIAYAYTTVDVPADTDAYIGMGSDDSARVWLNGQKVHEVWANRPVIANQDIFRVHLKAGSNTLLVKVQNFLLPGWGLQMELFLPQAK